MHHRTQTSTNSHQVICPLGLAQGWVLYVRTLFPPICHNTVLCKGSQTISQYIHFSILIVTPQNTCDGKLVRKLEQHIKLHQLFYLQKPVQFSYRAGSDSSAYCCMVALKDQWRTCMTIGCTILYKVCNSLHKSRVKHLNVEKENSSVQWELFNFLLCRVRLF